MKRRYVRHPFRPLTEEEKELVSQHIDMARKVACGVWRRAHLPASYLEELVSESLYFLCRKVITYEYEGDKINYFAMTIGWWINKWLWKVVNSWKRQYQITEDELQALVSSEKDNNVQIDSVLRSMSRLTQIERTVIELRYGMAGELPMTQHEISSRVGIGQPGINKAEKRAIKKLRELVSVPDRNRLQETNMQSTEEDSRTHNNE